MDDREPGPSRGVGTGGRRGETSATNGYLRSGKCSVRYGTVNLTAELFDAMKNQCGINRSQLSTRGT